MATALPSYNDLFPNVKPAIGVIHLPALPGAPPYGGNMDEVFAQAVAEAVLYQRHGCNALIIENFNDAPFYPGQVPHETTAAMAAISREVKNQISIPLGINVLRNDAHAALAIAAAVDAEFIRVNVHIAAVVADQGVIQGLAHETLRLRRALGSNALVFADVGVKHAAPLVDRGLALETRDLSKRGGADAIIVSGTGTGKATSAEDLAIVKENSVLPVLIGSGCTPESLPTLAAADGYIVGSYFKRDGQVKNELDPERIERFCQLLSK